ncbi:hypothetical protein HGM15179_003543 [Zosterops borbonicus]|uniref:Uncharacterized protein n=1 Tax=Zosterops borbonicus TaxID=364589 RepID=A0A8K1GQS7_9PASS|nr:hypothetical protein HGM15179_003543 [Zosterops borbonicus]
MQMMICKNPKASFLMQISDRCYVNFKVCDPKLGNKMAGNCADMAVHTAATDLQHKEGDEERTLKTRGITGLRTGLGFYASTSILIVNMTLVTNDFMLYKYSIDSDRGCTTTLPPYE